MKRLTLLMLGTVALLAGLACERGQAPARGPETTATSTSTPAPGPTEQTVELVVDGMHCATCPLTVRTAARAVPGVVEVEVSMNPGRARVRYRPAETDPKHIAAAITDSGYPARLGEL